MIFKLANMLSQKCGKISADRLASDKNDNCSRFNPKFLCPNTETVTHFHPIGLTKTIYQSTHFSHSESY